MNRTGSLLGALKMHFTSTMFTATATGTPTDMATMIASITTMTPSVNLIAGLVASVGLWLAVFIFQGLIR